MKMEWKTIAIIFMILFITETAYIGWAFWYVLEEEDKTNICLYDICSENTDAYYESNVCYCYDYSLLGELEIVKTEYMK